MQTVKNSTLVSLAKTMDYKKILLALISIAIGVYIWFGMPFAGLSPAGHKGMAIMIPTILFWLFQIMESPVIAWTFLTLVITLNVLPAEKFLVDWTGPNLWFCLVSFGLGQAAYLSGIVHRFAYYLIEKVGGSFIKLVIAIYLLNIAFSIFGMSASFPKVAIIYPIIIAIGATAGLIGNDNGALRGLGIAGMAALQPIPLIVFSGQYLNALAMSLAKVPMFFGQWFWMFGIPSIMISIASLLVVLVFFRPKGDLNISHDKIKEERNKMGSITSKEIRTMVLFGLIILMWITDSIHKLPPGWVGFLGIGILMLPGIGVIKFKEFMSSINWGIMFFLAAAYGMGQLVNGLGINKWLADVMLPSTAPSSPIMFTLMLSYVSMALHLVASGAAAAMSITIPPMAQYAVTQGWNPAIVAFIAYIVVWSQSFFLYQNAGVLMAFGYNTFTVKDFLKFGIIWAIVLPLVLAFLAIPYWSVMGFLKM